MPEQTSKPAMPSGKMNGKSSNAKYVTAEEGGTQVIIAGSQCTNQRRRSFFSWSDGWTKLELTLALMCVFLAVVVIALIIIVASPPHRTDGDSSLGSNVLGRPDSADQGILGAVHGGADRGPELMAKNIDSLKEGDICLTKGCVNAASKLLTAMDSSVDPCDNFFDYACGNWNKMNVIPDDRSSYNTFSKLIDEIQTLLKYLIEIPITAEDSEATKKAKNLYTSCLNESEINREGLKPIRNVVKELGGWPILDDPKKKEEGKDYDVLGYMIKLYLYDEKFLVRQWVSADDKNSRVNIIQLDQPKLGMDAPEYYMNQETNKMIAVYKKYAHDVAVMFGADEEQSRQDVEDLVQFEIDLAKITVPQERRRDNELMYNKMKVRELIKLVPEFDWLRYLQGVFKEVGIHIDENEDVVIYSPSYFEKFGKLMQTVDKRVAVNYLFWRFMMNRIYNLPAENRKIKNEYYKSIFGFHKDPPRWHECVTVVNEKMGNAVGKLFVAKHFDEGSRETALEMIHNIRNSFYELLREGDWMDEKTKMVAKEKAEVIAEKIGYADSIFNNTALDGEYGNMDIQPDTYFYNIMTAKRIDVMKNLKKLREPVDRTKWSTTPAVVNAFYSSNKNQIMFPAAILQPPFYSKEHPKSLNYGGIGMVIGHEITHGFDDRGRQYDKEGNLVKWWDDSVITKFKERAQCIIDQYSNYTVPEVNKNVNGIQTQGENIADNGGIKEAYRAYRKWVDDRGYEEPKLPGLLEYSNDQLFFINFAQIWCGVMRPESAINRINTGVHSPGRFRVIGTLQNLPSFSKAFKCAPDSYMNRKKKCTVW